MSENPLKDTFTRARMFPLLLILLMLAWWFFYLKPNQQTQQAAAMYSQGYFKVKEDAGIMGIFDSDYRHTAKGKTMGVIGYVIHYYDDQNRNLKPSIDSLLLQFNMTFSTYESESMVSQFNRSSRVLATPWLEDLHHRSTKVNEATQGAFDPTIGPLVSFWGFGSTPNSLKKDSSMVESLKRLVDYKQIGLENGYLVKKNPNQQLDYSAVAKGYGVDVVARFLESKGIKSYMVEIGGEIRVGAQKPSEEQWVLAIEDVNEMERSGKIFISLINSSIATSGNYRNYRVDSLTGAKYQHTIDPRVGYPVKNELLSVSVITENCLEADAYATALMVMGVEQSKAFAEENNLDVCLIYSDQEEIKVYYSSEFKKYVLNK